MSTEELLAKGYRQYHGEEVTVFFNKDRCTHSQNCIKGNKDVFDLNRKPWILADKATATEVMTLIDKCPSGALKYQLHEEE